MQPARCSLRLRKSHGEALCPPCMRNWTQHVHPRQADCDAAVVRWAPGTERGRAPGQEVRSPQTASAAVPTAFLRAIATLTARASFARGLSPETRTSEAL